MGKGSRLNAFGDVICPSCGANLIPPAGAVLVSDTGVCSICQARFFVTARAARQANERAAAFRTRMSLEIITHGNSD